METCACGCGKAAREGKRVAWGHGKNLCGPGEKWCSRCEAPKPLGEFSPGAGECKPCKTERASQYQRENAEKVNAKNLAWQKANPDKVREASRRRRSDPEVREREAAQGRARRQADPEAAREAQRAYYAANAERERLRQKKHKRKLIESETPDEKAARLARDREAYASDPKRRARSRQAAYDQNVRRRLPDEKQWVERVIRREVFDRDEGACRMCAAKLDFDSEFHIDHIVPLILGGEHSYANARLLCRRCNLTKGQAAEVRAERARFPRSAWERKSA